MSGTPRDTRDCGGDPAAYVLGALEPSEVDTFRAHMETCVVCRDEVVAFERTVDALALAVPQYRAPRGVRRRVLRVVRAEARGQPAHAQPRRALASGWLAGRPARAGLAVAALATVVAAVAIGVTVGSSSGARTLQASVVGLSGSARVHVANGRAELIVEHLPPPPAGRIYEVWLKRGAAAPSPTPTLFSVTRTGAGDIGVAGSLRGVTEVLVTPEPAGGSLVPTHAPVIVAHID
jgi:anti-sigma-K factor RskA